MTPEAQRVAIHQARGFKLPEPHHIPEGYSLADCIDDIPDYPADTNDAIELCDGPHRGGYNCDIHRAEDGLWRVTFSHPRNRNGYAEADTLAAAICEAYLKALNLWGKP